MGYFSNKVHRYFNAPKASVFQCYSTWDFCAPVQDRKAKYLLSGGFDFLWRVLKVLLGCQRLIVTVEFTRHSASRPMIQLAMKAGCVLLDAFDLLPLMVADSAAGGSMDSWHLFGFGRDLGTLATPLFEPGLEYPTSPRQAL